ncbi:MAG: hypothetical protein OHK0046_23630 [Anaerolineae bacterium]
MTDLNRAQAFYRAVFDLQETPLYDEPPAKIILLASSDKAVQKPGISLVQSPLHKPSDGGAVINFHIGNYEAFDAALKHVRQLGGTVDTDIVDMGDGVKYVNLLDCEGNRIALSAYEEAESVS